MRADESGVAGLLRRLGWLALLWTASVLALTAVALPIRYVLKAVS